MNRRARWILFVDESGTFTATREIRETVVLAGVLVREQDASRLSTALLGLTHRLFPGLPTPLHAAHLFSPAFHLLHRRAIPPVGALSAYVKALAEGVGTKGLERLDAAAQGDDLPSLDVLETWRRTWLPDDGALAAVVKALREQVQLRVHQLLSGLAEAYGPDDCALLAVVHDLEPSGPPAHALYRDMFIALAERVISLRRARPQPEEELLVLAEARGGLSREDLSQALYAAESFPLLTPSQLPDPRLRLDALSPQAKEGQHPGIVLADLAASLLRHQARHFRTWKEVAEWAPRGLGLPVQLRAAGVGTGPLPTLTTPKASSWLRDALWSDREAFAQMPGTWSADQAQRWLTAAKQVAREVAA